MENLIVILGPTAVGKTALSIELAKQLGTEIISGDSMLVYKGMDIGTAKPSLEERQGIPHHMLDIVYPDEEFSVAKFQSMVEDLITKINKKNRVPLLVGGTGLYIKAITDHFTFSPMESDHVLRDNLKRYAEKEGAEKLHQRLAEVDPIAASKLHPNDIRRVIRALEVYQQTGTPISETQKAKEIQAPKYNLFMYGLTLNREILYERINLRVDKMIEESLIDEVKALLSKGYNPQSSALTGLGYKEIIGYLEGQYSLEEAIDLLKRNTRRFAKRQLTWFRQDKRIKWLDVENYNNNKEIAKEILDQIAGQF